MILDDIIESKKQSLEVAKEEYPLEGLKERLVTFPPARDFEAAISYGDGKKDRIRIIAEVKRASPSKGMIREEKRGPPQKKGMIGDFFARGEAARGYWGGGAAAISIITEEQFFKGKL